MRLQIKNIRIPAVSNDSATLVQSERFFTTTFLGNLQNAQNIFCDIFIICVYNNIRRKYSNIEDEFLHFNIFLLM